VSPVRRPPAPWRGPAWWGVVVLVWLAAFWRVPALPDAWTPDGLLLALLGWAFAQRALPSGSSAAGRGALVGGLKDLASSGPFGSWLVVYAAAAWLAARAARTIAREEPVTQVVWVAVFALGTIAAHAGWLVLRGEGALAPALLGTFGLSGSLATGVASLLVFPLIKRVVAES